MKSNDDRKCSSSRRSFMKTAVAAALVATGPAVGADSNQRTTPRSAGSRKAEALLRRYGGEFGDVGREDA